MMARRLPFKFTVVRLLVEHDAVTEEMIARARKRDPNQPYAIKSLIHRVRALLKEANVELRHVSGDGWRISKEDKDAARRLLSRHEGHQP